MARRKKRKLNRKVVIAFAVIGGLLLLAGVGAIYRFRDKIWPPDPVVCCRLGDEAFTRGDLGEAVRQYKKAVGESKGLEKSQRLVKLSEYALRWLSVTPADQNAQRRERYSLFLQALEEAKRQTPDYLEPCKRLVEHWYNVIVQQQAGDRPYTQFLDEAENLLSKDPQDHLTHHRRGIVYALQMEASTGVQATDIQLLANKALADFREAIAIKKTSVEYRMRYIAFLQFLRVKGQATHEMVIEAFEDASRNLPDNPDFYVGLGTYLWRTLATDDKLKERYRPRAKSLFRTAVEKSPTSSAGYLAEADLLVDEGITAGRNGRKDDAAAAYAKAMTILAEARQKTQDLHRVCHAQAIVYEHQGLYDKGIDLYRQAIVELRKRSTSRPAEETPAGTASRPTTRPISPEQAKNMLAEMYYRLGHALLNDAGRKDKKDRTPLIEEAKKALVSMRELTKDPTGVNLEVRLAMLEERYDQAFRVLEETYQTNKAVLTLTNTMLLADLCMSRNIPNKAQDILKDMTEPAEPELRVQVLLLRARCRSMFGDASGANTLVEEALKLDPGNATALRLRSQLDTSKDREEALAKWRSGLRDEAIRDILKILQRKNDDIGAIRNLAFMYDAMGRRAELLSFLQETARRLPDNKEVRLTCEIYQEVDPSRRKAAYLRALQNLTEPFERNMQLAEFYAGENQPDQAVACLEQAFAARPKDILAPGQLFVLALRRQKFDDAAKWVKAIGGLDAELGRKAAGELAMAMRDVDGAIKEFTKFLATNKNAKDVYVNRARCWLAKEKYDDAEKDFRAAYDLDNRYLEAVIGLARTAVMRKPPNETEMGKWVQVANGLPDGLRDKWVRDMVLLSMERRKDTTVQALIQQRENYVAAAPDDADNRLKLGDLYMRSNEPPKAEVQFLQVYQTSKEERTHAAGRLADLYMYARRPEKAKAVLNDLQQKSEDRVGAMLVYADYMLRIDGPTPECKAAIEAAIKVDPKDPRGYVEMGKFHVAAQAWEPAVGAMEKALALDIKNVPDVSENDVRISRIECLVRAKKFDKALQGIDELKARDKTAVPVALLLNMMYLEQGEIDKAKTVLTDALKVHKDSEALIRTRGAVYLRLGELQEAKTDLARARELDPNDIAVGMTLGRVYERLRVPDQARAEYVAVISLNPTYRPAYQRLMQLYLQDQDWAKFSYLLEQARQTFPDDPTLLMQEGQMWMQRKEPERGLAKMKQASELTRGNDAGVLGVYLANLALQGRYAEMIATTDQRVAVTSQKAAPGWLLAARGLALAKLNKPAEAEAAFVEAVKTATAGEAAYIIERIRAAFGIDEAVKKAQAWGQTVPDNWDWQLELGNLISQQALKAPAGPQRESLARRAVEQITKARDLVKESNAKADIDFILGTFFQLVDRPQDAREAYQRVLKVSPQHLQANNNLAILCADELNEPKEALKAAETIMRFHEVDPNVLDTYGWALARCGDYEKALGVLSRARMQDLEMPDIRYHLGWLYEKLNRIPEARAEYKHGLDSMANRKSEKLYSQLEAAMKRTQP